MVVLKSWHGDPIFKKRRKKKSNWTNLKKKRGKAKHPYVQYTYCLTMDLIGLAYYVTTK